MTASNTALENARPAWRKRTTVAGPRARPKSGQSASPCHGMWCVTLCRRPWRCNSASRPLATNMCESRPTLLIAVGTGLIVDAIQDLGRI